MTRLTESGITDEKKRPLAGVPAQYESGVAYNFVKSPGKARRHFLDRACRRSYLLPMKNLHAVALDDG
jgi:hypothetical protein